MIGPPRPTGSHWTSLIDWFRWAFDEQNLILPLPLIEALAVDVYTAMGAPLRRFHTLDHLFSFEPEDGIETLATLYHDVVYWSVDGAWPSGFPVLGEVAPTGQPGTALALTSSIPHYAEVLAVFGLVPGGATGKVGGNEVFSALAFSSVLGEVMGRERTLAVAACIETTIPFRGHGARLVLQERLVALGLREVDGLLSRAVRMANQDVGDFRLEDPGTFLGGTWNLLPELNPELRIGSVFTIGAYRKALLAMDGFFAFLTPDLLYDSWGDEPPPLLLASWKAQAAINLRVARRYLSAKLSATALLEAMALVTGPDVPLSLFMGAAADEVPRRLESLLPPVAATPEIDPVFFLLEWGRSTEASFDLTNSPVAAWIYRQLTLDERDDQERRNAQFFGGTLEPRAFLAQGKPAIVQGLIRALAEFVPTRRAELLSLSTQL